jgi:hypothetical protein
MVRIAEAMVLAAGKTAEMFLKAWLEANAWVKFLSAAVLFKKFGGFKLLGYLVATPFLQSFTKAFVAGFAVEMGIATGVGGRITAAMTSAGLTAGTAFGAAFVPAAIAAMAVLASLQGENAADRALKPDASMKSKIWAALTSGINLPLTKLTGEGVIGNLKKLFGGASGGVIPPGGTSFVGERGIELARATPTGTEIVPLSRNSLSSLRPVPEAAGLGGAVRFQLYTSVQVDRREIARAYNDQTAFDAARRGGTPLMQEGVG